MTGQMTSTGRGGAGNIADASKSPKIQPTDLQTPTLKTSIVTTGRGGSGNMAPNTDPVETRARQDVGPIERRPSQGATHVGRGGAANVARLNSEETEVSKASLDGSASEDTHHHNNNYNNNNNNNNNQHHNGKNSHNANGANGLAAKAKEFFKKV